MRHSHTIKAHKGLIKGVIAGHAMVAYCVTKIITTFSPMIVLLGQYFDTMIVASIDESGDNDTSESNYKS